MPVMRSILPRFPAANFLLAAWASVLHGQSLTFLPPPARGVTSIAAGSRSLYLAGTSLESNFNPQGARAILQKLDASGKELWVRIFDEGSTATAVAASEAG